MDKSKNINLWQCDLTLHDYLYFKTARRGYITETGRFIHNYALTYAMGLAKSEWRQERQKPQYAEQLNKIEGVYVTPAKLLMGNHSTMLCRSETEGYALPVTPGLGSCRTVKCFGPGSVFRFYVLARSNMERIPSIIRLGRYMAKAEIIKYYPKHLELAEGSCITSSLLNWDDMAVRPSLCDIIVYALPTRLIENARFPQTRYLKAEFDCGEEVKLPIEMGYLRKELCSSWWEDAA